MCRLHGVIPNESSSKRWSPKARQITSAFCKNGAFQVKIILDETEEEAGLTTFQVSLVKEVARNQDEALAKTVVEHVDLATQLVAAGVALPAEDIPVKQRKRPKETRFRWPEAKLPTETTFEGSVTYVDTQCCFYVLPHELEAKVKFVACNTSLFEIGFFVANSVMTFL